MAHCMDELYHYSFMSVIILFPLLLTSSRILEPVEIVLPLFTLMTLVCFLCYMACIHFSLKLYNQSMYLLISLPTTYIAFSYGNVHALTYCFTVCKNISFVNFPVLYAQCLKSFIVCTFRIDYYLDYYYFMFKIC